QEDSIPVGIKIPEGLNSLLHGFYFIQVIYKFSLCSTGGFKLTTCFTRSPKCCGLTHGAPHLVLRIFVLHGYDWILWTCKAKL
ncbi:hypothetical protein STEG23_009186, partial [Scotinomys teguina]